MKAASTFLSVSLMPLMFMAVVASSAAEIVASTDLGSDRRHRELMWRWGVTRGLTLFVPGTSTTMLLMLCFFWFAKSPE